MLYILYYITIVRTGGEPGNRAGQGGESHCDHGHPGYNVHGGFGGMMAHHNGMGEHSGDTGKNHIRFTDDVMHHGAGGVYVNLGPTSELSPHTDLTVDDIHHKMSDAMVDAHNASIASKEAARKAEVLKSSIAAERAKQKEEEIAMLKALDDEAAKEEHLKPEVLGKASIPVATFTEESFPLFHHVRDLLSKIKAIKETEEKAIEAQKMITRLDDITDQVRLQDVALENPDVYRNFINAGRLQNMRFNVPVADKGGRFYLSNSSGDMNSRTHNLPVKEHTYADGHSHYVNHGDATHGDLESGGRSVGEECLVI